MQSAVAFWQICINCPVKDQTSEIIRTVRLLPEYAKLTIVLRLVFRVVSRLVLCVLRLVFGVLVLYSVVCAASRVVVYVCVLFLKAMISPQSEQCSSNVCEYESAL